MGQLANTPTWGILVKEHIEKVREILAPFGDDFVFRTNNGWTAAFHMEPGNASDDEAAERFRSRGYVPVYRFDFSKYGFSTVCWDGERWSEGRDPGVVLEAVGIRAPYWDEQAVGGQPLQPHEAIVVEGTSVEQARAIVGERWRIEAGPRGAIVYGPEGDTHDILISTAFNDARFALWERAPQRVLQVKFYPKSGEFWFVMMKGEDCLGTFRPGQARTWDGTPFLASVEGETEPEAIVENLGIPRSFVART